MKRKTIWIIEDDLDNQESMDSDCAMSSIISKCDYKFFQYIEDLENELGSPDFIIADIGCLSDMHENWYYKRMNGFHKLADKYPNSIVLLMCSVFCWAEDTINQVKEQFRDKNIIAFSVDHSVSKWEEIIKNFMDA